MTVYTLTSEVTHSGDGSNTAFPFSFVIQSTDNLQIYKISSSGVETLLAKDVDYSVTLTEIRFPTTGSITYPLSGSALAASEKIRIERVLTVTQETDFENQDGFYPELHENALDKLTMLIQQLSSDISGLGASADDLNDLVTDLEPVAGGTSIRRHEMLYGLPVEVFGVYPNDHDEYASRATNTANMATALASGAGRLVFRGGGKIYEFDDGFQKNFASASNAGIEIAGGGTSQANGTILDFSDSTLYNACFEFLEGTEDTFPYIHDVFVRWSGLYAGLGGGDKHGIYSTGTIKLNNVRIEDFSGRGLWINTTNAAYSSSLTELVFDGCGENFKIENEFDGVYMSNIISNGSVAATNSATTTGYDFHVDIVDNNASGFTLDGLQAYRVYLNSGHNLVIDNLACTYLTLGADLHSCRVWAATTASITDNAPWDNDFRLDVWWKRYEVEIEAAGTTKAGATLLTKDFNFIDTINPGVDDGVLLPVTGIGEFGKEITIVNEHTTASLVVWPQTAQRINNGAMNAAVTMPPATTWRMSFDYKIGTVGSWNILSEVSNGDLFGQDPSVAAAGNSQGTGTALTLRYNLVTSITASSAEAVVLPAAVTRKMITIHNVGGDTLKVFPASGDAIDGGSVDASVDVADGDAVTYYCFDETTWRSIVTGGSGGVFSAIASQAEAEAGSDNTKGMTPLRVAQAIAALETGGGGDLVDPMTTNGDIIIESSGPSRLGVGTEGQVLTSVSGFPAWADASGGGGGGSGEYEHIADHDLSAVGTSGTIISDADAFASGVEVAVIRFKDIILSNDGDGIRLQLTVGGTPVTASYLGFSSYDSTAADGESSPTTYIELAGAGGAAASELTIAYGEIRIYNPSDTSHYKHYEGYVMLRGTGNYFRIRFGGSYEGGTGAIDGVKIYTTANTISSGYAHVFKQTISGTVSGLYGAADGLSATGTTQGAGYTIANKLNRFTTVTAASAEAADLPAALPGYEVIIRNDHATDTLKVFPASGEQIDANGTNASDDVAAGSVVTYRCYTAGQWYSS